MCFSIKVERLKDCNRYITRILGISKCYFRVLPYFLEGWCIYRNSWFLVLFWKRLPSTQSKDGQLISYSQEICRSVVILTFPLSKTCLIPCFLFPWVNQTHGWGDISFHAISHRRPFLGQSRAIALRKVMCKIWHYIVPQTWIIRKRVNCFLPLVNENIPRESVFPYEAIVGL